MTKYKNLGVRPTGSMGEYATLMLIGSGHLVRRKSHDLRFGKTFVEVKSGRARKDGGWVFNITDSQKRWSPMFAFVCFERGDSFKIEKFYLIPKSEILGLSTLWIPADNKSLKDFRVW